ncbi:MAG TPA: tetraacyldisaccharide 4'-kinase [Blastocatellia bacterium]|nr:tetraacyldisaccharide 4'-kinase [Blastocatellia bacterium]
MFASLLKFFASRLYAAGVRWRLRRYRSGRLKTHHLNAPVISIGNLTVGGTGKTPCTAFIANFLKADGLNVAILSRGYKRQSKGLVEVSDGQNILCDAARAGDEPYLLAQLCPGVRVVVNANRYDAGKWLEAKTRVDVFLLDDGYQHIQLHRDLNLLLLDGENPVGNGQVLPSGILREPLEELARAEVVIGTRMTHAVRDEIRALLYFFGASKPPLFFAHHEIAGFQLLNNAPPLKQFKQAKVAAFSGIAQPARFFADLERKQLQLVYNQAFPDHHRYSVADLTALFQQAAAQQTAAIITTEKDAANLPPEVLSQTLLPIYTAQLQFRMENETDFKRLIREKIKR